MSRLVNHLSVRPRLMIALVAGVLAFAILPGAISLTTRSLVGWNVSVWLYLVLISVMMVSADHEKLRQVAVAQAGAAVTVLGIAIVAAIASLAGIAAELAQAKVPGARYALPHLMFAIATVAGSWALVPTLFALTYASQYYEVAHGHGLKFPDASVTFKPDYGDFLYFAFTIAVASQTADVSITSQPMRRLVLLHSVMSFVFNAAVLAFTINVAASTF